MSRTIYVAGSSKELDRAAKWMQKLRDAGVEVLSTWVENIKEVGHANPIGAPRELQQQWSMNNLDQVAQSGAFWLLLPETPTSGAWIELGYALALFTMSVMAVQQGALSFARPYILCSGKTKTIFTSLIEDHFDTDEEAFAHLTSAPPVVGSPDDKTPASKS